MRDQDLLKAISDMEAIAKGESVSPGMSGKGNDTPKTTSQANGGLSGEGDQKELSVTATSPSHAAKGEGEEEEEFDFDALDDDEFDFDSDEAAKGGKKKKTLSQWAKEEEEEEAHKGGDSDDDDDEDESMDDDEEEDVTKCKTKKSAASLADVMKSDASTGPVMDVAPFLERLVDQVSDSIDTQNQAIAQLQRQLNSQHRVLKALGNVQLGLQKSLNNFGEMPVGERRSVLSKSEINERFEPEQPEISKADVLDAMVDLCQQGKLDPVAVSRYEATNTMEPEIAKSVEGYMLKKSA